MSNEVINPESDESRQAYWRRVLQEWQASGLKGREYQRRHNLSQHAFVYWKLKLIGGSDKKPRLVAVKHHSVGQQAMHAHGIRIHAGELFIVELSEGFDPSTLRAVLAVVRECAE